MTVQVLVVDDQAPFREAMAEVVGATDGFTVVGRAATGEEAVAACATLRPDLVLLDVNLPGIDGHEAARQMRELPDPPVVLLLSTYDAEDVALTSAAGYVAKRDFEPQRLVSVWASVTAG